MRIRLAAVLSSLCVGLPCVVFGQEPPARSMQTTGQRPTLVSFPHSRCEPQPENGHHDTCRGDMELALGFTYLRFHSSQFNANTFGLNTDFSYYIRPWMSAEAEVNSAWGPQSSSSALAKSFVYGGGIRLIDPRDDKVRPWVHALIGGVHMLPQTAFGRNGFAATLGGGADVKLRYWLWLRLETNYVRSQMYTQEQNNLQVISTVVYRF